MLAATLSCNGCKTQFQLISFSEHKTHPKFCPYCGHRDTTEPVNIILCQFVLYISDSISNNNSTRLKSIGRWVATSNKKFLRLPLLKCVNYHYQTSNMTDHTFTYNVSLRCVLIPKTPFSQILKPLTIPTRNNVKEENQVLLFEFTFVCCFDMYVKQI